MHFTAGTIQMRSVDLTDDSKRTESLKISSVRFKDPQLGLHVPARAPRLTSRKAPSFGYIPVDLSSLIALDMTRLHHAYCAWRLGAAVDELQQFMCCSL